jgi:hypothetical protein
VAAIYSTRGSDSPRHRPRRPAPGGPARAAPPRSTLARAAPARAPPRRRAAAGGRVSRGNTRGGVGAVTRGARGWRGRKAAEPRPRATTAGPARRWEGIVWLRTRGARARPRSSSA